MNTQQSSENPRRAATTATIRAYLVPVLVILLVITGGFSIYALNTGLRTNVESNAQPSRAAQLTTRISTQTVTRTYSGEVSVSPARSYTVGTPQGVVTRDGAKAGTQLSNGSIITTINERPIIAFKGSIPAYRDLAVGARGDDVKQLQEALESLGYSIWDDEGNYGEATANAVYRFYLDRGYYPPGDTDRTEEGRYNTALPLSEYLFADGNEYTVDNSCGTKGQTSTPALCTLSAGGYRLVLSADGSALSNELAEGQKVQILTDNGSPLEGTLGSALTPEGSTNADGGANAGASNGAQNSARPNSDTSAQGATARKRYPITIDLPENTTASTRFQATVTLNRGAENALAVLEAAVKTEENGTHSITLDNGQSVPVTLGVCSAGICELVNPAAELKAGTVVKLKER